MLSKSEAVLRAKTVFNAASDHFDDPALSFWNRFGQQTIDRLSLCAGDHVLDVCCGTGASALPAAICVGSTGHVLGIDLAESLLDLARRKAQQQGLGNIEFRDGDFETLGLPSNNFDAVVCVFGIFFVPDMVAALRELWRMVRPGGKLAITSWGQQVFEPATQLFWETIAAERPDLYRTSAPWDRINNPAALQGLFEAAGVTQVQVFSEVGTHELASPDDWWTMMLGGGLRGLIDQLDSETRERIRQANLQALQTQNIHSLAVEVLYAIAQKE